jgi:hypothetical protein
MEGMDLRLVVVQDDDGCLFDRVVVFISVRPDGLGDRGGRWRGDIVLLVDGINGNIMLAKGRRAREGSLIPSVDIILKQLDKLRFRDGNTQTEGRASGGCGNRPDTFDLPRGGHILGPEGRRGFPGEGLGGRDGTDQRVVRCKGDPCPEGIAPRDASIALRVTTMTVIIQKRRLSRCKKSKGSFCIGTSVPKGYAIEHIPSDPIYACILA